MISCKTMSRTLASI
ncbi:hypothetical protein F383_29172 [Gossypium arboreum]|uniref:Uncharacterized protein n=1 Tax=Gossypium arboreum TaxID=29729 RepID=A0A0B0PCF1_GOSAR|nr:hypothetical protein F383_29172 [Gossypium arboreum]